MAKQKDAASRLLFNRINLESLATDPTDLLDGDMWHNSTSDTIKVRLNGVTKTITTS